MQPASRGLLISTLAVVLVLPGCLTTSEPACPTHPVVVLGAETGRAYSVSDSCASASALPVTLPRVLDAFAMSPDSAVLYFTGSESVTTARYLFAFDLRSLHLMWRRDLAEIATRSSIDGLTVIGNYAVAVSGDGTRLILNGERDGVPGLVSLSLDSLEPVAFYGPFVTPPDGTALVVPSPRLPTGAIAVVGTRQTSERPTKGMLLVLTPNLVPVDSVILVPASDDRWGGMHQVATSADGQAAYVSTADSILQYSIPERTITARIAPPTQGWLNVDSERDRIYLTDPGDGRDTPGSGLVLVFDLRLAARAPVDLRTEGMNGVLPVTHRAVPAVDTDLLYVTSGTASRGPLYGPQPARVFVVDPSSGVLRQVVALDDWGAVRAFPTRR